MLLEAQGDRGCPGDAGIKEGLAFPYTRCHTVPTCLHLECLKWQAIGMNGLNARIYSGMFSVAPAENLAQDSSTHNWTADLLL